VLGEGGNAADAAVCVAFVLAVTHPEAGNLGGGSFLLAHFGGSETAIDAREVAPEGATRDMYLDEAGEPLPEASLVGPLAAGVPGSVAGYLLLHQRFGTMDRRRLLDPAIRLARDGFVVDKGLHESLRRHADLLGRFPETRAVFLPRGRVPEPGDVLRQPELASVLEDVARRGADGFYRGAFARRLEEACVRHGARITAKDLALYEAKERAPLRRAWRGFDVVTMPPPSSGGAVLLQMLAMTELGDYASMRPTQRMHLLAEASRRAFADRARWFGDPDFVDVPVDAFLDPLYVRSRFASIDMGRATRSAAVGAGALATEAEATCHFSVVDGRGNAVACTTTLNGAYGCGLAVSGVLLNNEMDDFAAKPGAANQFGLVQGEANAIEPGKRPLSSMTPTIVLRDGEPVLVLGSPGGPTIISTVCQVMLRHLVLGEDLEASVEAPRLHHQWLPDELVHEAIPPEDARALAGLGHALRLRETPMGDVQACGRNRHGQMVAVSDPRGRGATAGRSR
jgi:gamma-glutamyltranspeptidase/glutathione hydrolase